MNNFASFSEDALPRNIPLPSVDPRTLSLKANAALPSVPELSMLNYDVPASQPLPAPKPTSYSVWKNEHMNGKIGSSQIDTNRPVQRKTVTFDTPLMKPDSPDTNENAAYSMMNNKQVRGPNLCGQLELSEYESPCFQSQQSYQNAGNSGTKTHTNGSISQIQQMRQEIVDKVNQDFVPPSPTVNQKENVVPFANTTHPVEPQNANSSELLPIIMEMIRMMSDKSNVDTKIYNNSNAIPSETENARTIKEVSPPKAIDLKTSEQPSLKDLHELVLKQQKEILLLREQVNHLMHIQQDQQCKTSMDQPTQMHQTQPSVMSPPDQELALGEEASSMPNNQHHQTPQQPQQFQRRHHNSPADWKFYGNTLEQVAQILQNAPTTRSSPPQPNHHQVEKLIQVNFQGMHFSDVNLSATQRVTFATPPSSNPLETPKQHNQRQNYQNGSHPALTDRSLAMNTLALKYLPDHQIAQKSLGVKTTPDGRENKAPTLRRSKSPEVSAMTLDYLHKYGLLGNKRLFDE